MILAGLLSSYPLESVKNLILVVEQFHLILEPFLCLAVLQFHMRVLAGEVSFEACHQGTCYLEPPEDKRHRDNNHDEPEAKQDSHTVIRSTREHWTIFTRALPVAIG